MAIQKFELELLSSKMITKYTIQLTLKRADNVAFDFEPGQFITFLFDHEDGKLRRRSYSVASIKTETKEIELAASYVKGGIATDHLFNMKVGEKYNAMGPAGRLILKDEPLKRLILVGTGTGIAPYRAMLPLLENRITNDNVQVNILLGVQYRADALYASDFEKYDKKLANLSFISCLSREESELTSHERKGYVQDQFDSLNLNPDEDVIYLCGNPNMIDETYERLLKLGFTNKNIRREKYISSN